MVTSLSGEQDLVSQRVQHLRGPKKSYEKLGPSFGVVTLDLLFGLWMAMADGDVSEGSGCDILAAKASQPIVRVSCVRSSKTLI
jgi:hypothetical protein